MAVILGVAATEVGVIVPVTDPAFEITATELATA